MSISPQILANRLREEGERVEKFFYSLTQEQWCTLVYPQESDWSMHHLLAHFVSSENGRNELIVNVYNGGKGAPSDFQIDLFNQREVERLSIEANDKLLQCFNQQRSTLIEHISSMSPADLERIGNDPFLGEVALSEMIKLTYRHIQIHLRDARRYL
jgi:hypothetical protein